MRWLIVSLALLALMCIPAQAKDPAPAKAETPPVEWTYNLLTSDPPSTETVRFLLRRQWEPTPDKAPKEVKQTVLVVYLDGARPAVERTAYVEIERRTDCAAAKVAGASYSAHAADGAVLASGAALPDDLAPFAEGRSLDSIARLSCATTSKTPTMFVPVPDHGTLDLHYQSWLPAKDIPAALALARERQATIAAALSLPEKGRYMYVAGTAGREAALLDTANLDDAGGTKRISWLVVHSASHEDGAGYVRASFDVDCDQKVATPAMIAQFDADGRLIKVAGAGQANSFGRLSGDVAGLLKTACLSDGPRMFDDTYRTFTKALARGREALAH